MTKNLINCQTSHGKLKTFIQCTYVDTMDKSRSYKRYSKEAMAEAIDAIKSKKLTIYRASKIYGVPRATLSDRINGMSIMINIFIYLSIVKHIRHI